MKLINEDYEEFLSLGTGLRGEEERLQRLEGPLQGVRKDIVVRCFLSQAILILMVDTWIYYG